VWYLKYIPLPLFVFFFLRIARRETPLPAFPPVLEGEGSSHSRYIPLPPAAEPTGFARRSCRWRLPPAAEEAGFSLCCCYGPGLLVGKALSVALELRLEVVPPRIIHCPTTMVAARKETLTFLEVGWRRTTTEKAYESSKSSQKGLRSGVYRLPYASIFGPIWKNLEAKYGIYRRKGPKRHIWRGPAISRRVSSSLLLWPSPMWESCRVPEATPHNPSPVSACHHTNRKCEHGLPCALPPSTFCTTMRRTQTVANVLVHDRI
jgi:hypothetical protein